MKNKTVFSAAVIGLSLAFAMNNNALADAYDGTGFVDCALTFSYTTPWGNEVDLIDLEAEVFTIDGHAYIEGMSTVLNVGEVNTWGPFDANLVKKGRKYELTFDQVDEDGDTYSAKFKYPKTGGTTQFHVRENNGIWINMLNYHYSDSGYELHFSGSCDFDPNV